jgi:hypothetical protein
MILTLYITVALLSTPPAFSQRAGPVVMRVEAVLESREVLQPTIIITRPELLQIYLAIIPLNGIANNSIWLRRRVKGSVCC